MLPLCYRKRIGLELALYLVNWARGQGWERIEGQAFASPDIDDAYVWIPSVEFWEKAGFRRINEYTFDPDHAGIKKSGYEFAIDLNQQN